MQIKKVLWIAIRIVATCLLFAICLIVGGALSGVGRVAQQQPPAQSSPQVLSPSATPPQDCTRTIPKTPPDPSTLMFAFLTFSLCVGVVSSYFIVRSTWHGWTLAGALFVAMYGVSTVVTQIESLFFLSNKLPHGMVRALFAQEAITIALFAPLAVLLLGKWRAATTASPDPSPANFSASSVAWRIAFLILAFVFLYMFFGYYIAWRNPELRHYYGGAEWPTFYDSLKGNWLNSRWIFSLQVFRALLYIAFVYPLVRMLRVPRWESAIATALFLSAWTTFLLFPNPLMPASVARSHFYETLGFSLVFGTLLGWLLNLRTPDYFTAKQSKSFANASGPA
jgi:hypothetical protein